MRKKELLHKKSIAFATSTWGSAPNPGIFGGVIFIFLLPHKEKDDRSRPISRHGHRRPRLYRGLTIQPFQKEHKNQNHPSRLEVSRGLGQSPMKKSNKQQRTWSRKPIPPPIKTTKL
jgi:hypothetical protein